MKILILSLFFAFCLVWPDFNTPYAAEAPKEDAVPADATKSDKKTGDEQKQEAKETPGEYDCPYYSVHLPPDWKAIRAPEERQGLVNAIFAKNPNSPIVTMIVGPRHGAEPELIASMFADQFKASKAPSQKNGQFFFSFPQSYPGAQNPVTAHACIGIDGDYFMLTTYTGSQKEVRNFFSANVNSKEYPSLIPQF